MSQAKSMKYMMTNDSITVVWDGRPVTVKKGAPNFGVLREAILAEDWDEVPLCLTVDTALERWAKGKFKVFNGKILFKGEELPTEINGRITEMASLGRDPTPIMRFWENLQRNPSNRSIKQLWRFLSNSGHPLTTDGHFLAYKAVDANFKDYYTKTIDNSPGVIVEMERNKISDDPNETCHYGLHVGGLRYAKGFGSPDGHVVIVKVNPRDVVSVPVDHASQKMRVCRYEVIGLYGDGPLSNTTIDDDDLPIVDTNRRSSTKDDGKERPNEFKRLDTLDEASLMKETYETLRNYLSKGLKVVGASQIIGGKWALVQAIVNTRKARLEK
jgi:hypothetical protein